LLRNVFSYPENSRAMSKKQTGCPLFLDKILAAPMFEAAEHS
jgi:hypothetical protein